MGVVFAVLVLLGADRGPLPALHYSPALSRVAQEAAIHDMDPSIQLTDREVWEGGNIIYGTPLTAREANRYLMTSTPHRANILHDPGRHCTESVGIGYTRYAFTELFVETCQS